jgi:FkbM family methyltransferase
VSRTVSPTGRPYATYDPEEVHDRIWGGFSGATGWDIGANEGQSVDRMVTQFGHVLAFEPAWESFVRLAADWAGDPRVDVFRLAAGAEPGWLELSVCPHAIEGGQLIATHMIADPGTDNPWFSNEVSRRTVGCVTLDLVAELRGEVPDFVKIDTEGGEADILRGACVLVTGGKTDFLVEFHSPRLRRECEALLRGYAIERVRNPGFAGDPDLDANGWLRARHP